MNTSISERFYASYCAALAQVVTQHRPEQAPLSIVVALGGGADSQSVLDLTLRYRAEHPEHRYLAIHLDHYFHPSSPQWAEFLREQCLAHGIDCIIEAIDVPVEGRQSKEAQGRQARYQRLAELTDERAVILLGHHLSDQSETFLLQLKRGSGPKGLASMAALAPFVGQRLLCRPLLEHPKADIYRYAKQRDLKWIEDDTNTDTRIERNFLRHEVLPVLTKRWPQFEHTLARSARLCAEQQSLLESLLAAELERECVNGALATNNLVQHSAAHQRALLRLFIEQQGGVLPSEAQLQQILQQLQGARVDVGFANQRVVSFAGYLHLLPRFAEVKDFYWQGQLNPGRKTLVELPDAVGQLNCIEDTSETGIWVAPTDTVRVGFCQSGERFQRRAGGSEHTVAQRLKKYRVAPWWRTRWPAVWVNDELAWVAELGANAGYRPQPLATQGAYWQFDWQRGAKAPKPMTK